MAKLQYKVEFFGYEDKEKIKAFFQWASENGYLVNLTKLEPLEEIMFTAHKKEEERPQSPVVRKIVPRKG